MSVRDSLTNGIVQTRSYVLVASASFGFASFTTSGTAIPLCKLPVDAFVIGGILDIETAFDAATSDTVIVGDGVDPNQYWTAVDAQAAGPLRMTLFNAYDAGASAIPIRIATTEVDVEITNTWVGAKAAAGLGSVFITYVDVHKGDENFEG